MAPLVFQPRWASFGRGSGAVFPAGAGPLFQLRWAFPGVGPEPFSRLPPCGTRAAWMPFSGCVGTRPPTKGPSARPLGSRAPGDSNWNGHTGSPGMWVQWLLRHTGGWHQGRDRNLHDTGRSIFRAPRSPLIWLDCQFLTDAGYCWPRQLSGLTGCLGGFARGRFAARWRDGLGNEGAA